MRACVGLLAVGLLGLAAWPAGDLAAGDAGRPGVGAERQQGQRPTQKKRAEEEEEGGAKPAPKQGGKKRRVEEEEEGAKPAKRKVVRVEEEEGKAKAGRPAAVPLGDLAEAARQAKHPAVKRLFQDLAVPHDLVTYRKFEVKVGGDMPPQQPPERVDPLPDYVSETPSRLREAVTLKVQDAEGRVRKQETRTPGELRSIKPYEEIALEKVEEFLGAHYEKFGPAESNPQYLARPDQLVAAEHALSAVLRFHESAKGRGVRKGEEWEPVEANLRKHLLDVSLEQLNALTAAKDWGQAFELGKRLYDTYGSPADKAKIARPLAELLKRAVKDLSANDDNLREARKRLQQFQQQFGDRPEVAAVGKSLQEQAQALFDQAKEMARDKATLSKAQELLKQAEETWPALPGLRDYRVKLSLDYPILRVGVRELPQYLSPARACTDSELRGVELLFESLVKQHPDALGVMRYEAGLAEGRPRVISGGRRFHLPRNARWSGGQQPSVTASDVRKTVQLLQEGRGNGRSAEWGKLLESVKVGGDPYVVDLTLTQGFLDPLALMTFKVLPGHVPDVDGVRFAVSPVSSGPFQYLGRKSEEGGGGRQYAAFAINPNYGSRPDDKFGRPSIREVRFFACTDPAREFEQGRLDLALDLTAEEAAKLQGAPRVRVDLPRPGAPNRRVYFLALNQRRPLLVNVKLRRALAYAINREKLLDDHFRGGLKIHKAINGPYPAGSWACNPELKKDRNKDSLDIFDDARAKALAREALDELKLQPADARLTLLYPSGDARLAKALEALRDQVRAATGAQLELQARDPHRLRDEVEVSNAYDLAYYHYDFPDETYWLKPLLGSPGPGRENYLGAQGGPALNQLQEAMSRRHFADVRKHTWLAHEQLLQEMPLVPLWQLDPLAALSEDLEAVPFDPLLVFTDVDRWSVQRK